MKEGKDGEFYLHCRTCTTTAARPYLGLDAQVGIAAQDVLVLVCRACGKKVARFRIKERIPLECAACAAGRPHAH